MREVILPQQAVLFSDCFHKTEEYVQICSLEVLNRVMSKSDPNWFEAFKEEDRTHKIPVTKNIESLDEMDFQAAVKVFYYRQSQIKPVYDAYGIDIENESFRDRLKQMIDTRNDISGHLDLISVRSKYAEIDSDEAFVLIQKFRVAINNFVYFLSFFSDVCDANGNSYLALAKAERSKTEKQLHLYQYNVEKTIAKESLNISVNVFESICKELHIAYRSDDDGNSYFYTIEYAKTIQAIRALSRAMLSGKERPVNAPTKKSNKYIKIAIIVVVLFVVFSVVAIMALLGVLVLGQLLNRVSTLQTSDNRSPMWTQSSQYEEPNDPIKQETPAQPSESLTPVIPRITGEGRLGELCISVNQIPSTYLTFDYNNQGDLNYSLGWVDSAKVTVTTTSGDYHGSIMNRPAKIQSNSTGTLSALFTEEFEGTITEIKIYDILPLSDRGLPEFNSTQGLVIKIPITYQ